LKNLFITIIGKFPVDEQIWIWLEYNALGRFEKCWNSLTDRTLTNDHGETLLVAACAKGSRHIVSFLLEQGGDLSLKDSLGNTPFAKSIIGGHTAIAKMLLEKGANANDRVCLPEPNDDEDEEDNEDLEKMLNLVGLEGLDKLGELVDMAQKELKLVGNDSSCLMWAACEGNLPMVKLLLQHKANLTETDEEGNSALYYSVYNGHSEIAKLLIKLGSDIHLMNKEEGGLLHVAALRGHIELSKLLIDKGVDINSRIPGSGDTPLGIAVSSSILHDQNPTIMLIESGADPDLRDSDGNSPLVNACAIGFAEGVVALLKAGASTNFVDNSGNTAYDYARENSEFIENLETLGVSLNDLKPTKSVTLTKAYRKTLSYLKVYLPIFAVIGLIGYFSTTFGSILLALVLAWWGFRLYRKIKRKQQKEAPFKRAGEVLMRAAEENEMRERKNKEIEESWED
jgi:ankyrin repeat protein